MGLVWLVGVADAFIYIRTLTHHDTTQQATATRMRAELAEEETVMEGLRHTVETLSAQLEGRLAFEYRDPEKGFDRARVKGLVARLVTLKDPSTATAVEVVAGAKLYQVRFWAGRGVPWVDGVCG